MFHCVAVAAIAATYTTAGWADESTWRQHLEPAVGTRHPLVVDTLFLYAGALKRSGRKAEAKEIERRLKSPNR